MRAEASLTEQTNPRGRRLAGYVAATARRRFPPEVIEAAKQALVDFMGVAIGAYRDGPAVSVRRAAEAWQARGNAQMLLGPRTAPALAALVNGTMAHCMDYDDTHPGGAGHPSGACWSTALAMAGHHGLSEHDALAGFITGFEVMTRLGGGFAPGVGRSLQRRGFHPTSVFGRAGAAAAACAMLRLDEAQVANALGVAATTAGGLLGSFGTYSKPFHPGKAAMDGILAAQLAAEGFEAATHLFELERGLLDAFIQDRQVEVPPLDFDARWELLQNGFKPFACCRATQPSTQAARSLAAQVGAQKVLRVEAKVHPNALVTAGKLAPKTPLEGKFSVPFCIAIGLSGYRAVAPDFSAATLRDPRVMAIVPVVKLQPVEGQPGHEAHLDVYLADGTHLHADTAIVIGHPDNPMGWDDLHTKFMGLVEPILGPAQGERLYETLRRFERPGTLGEAMALVSASAAPRT
ncbi:MAG: MmgE/PrpD family protein [Candidatus Lambdaproteobacteria bacterium]|nr:MmgE/PrpD family protein [Candidatus Lambdaproteobacteria bacterium]